MSAPRHSARAAWDVFDPRDGITRRTFRTERAARMFTAAAQRRRMPYGRHVALVWDYAPHGTGYLSGRA